MSGIPAHEIGIVDCPGAQVACILGLTDLFAVASSIALDQRRSGQSPLRVRHWKPIHCGATNLSCVSIKDVASFARISQGRRLGAGSLPQKVWP